MGGAEAGGQGSPGWGHRSSFGCTLSGGQGGLECGFEAADAAGREKGHGGGGEGSLASGEVEGSCQGHSQEARAEDGKEGKPQSGKARPM